MPYLKFVGLREEKVTRLYTRVKRTMRATTFKIRRTVARQSAEQFALERLRKRMDRSYKLEGVRDFSYEEFAEWSMDWEPDYSEALEEFHIARSRYWVRRAHRMLIDLPPESKEDELGMAYWEFPYRSRLRSRILTDRGVAYVRRAIRDEQLERHRLLRENPLFIMVVSMVSAVAIYGASRLLG